MKVKIPNRGLHIMEANRSNSLEKFVGASGDINAYDKKDLLKSLLELSNMISAGEVHTDVSHSKSKREIAAENRQILTAAYHNQGETSWAELGSGLAAELSARAERDGFMRNVLQRYETTQGADPKVRVRTPNVRAVISKGVGNAYPQYVRDRYILVDEFTLSANPRVLDLDLQKGSSDILEDKFYEAQEAINVKEDTVLYQLFNASVGLYNEATYFAGEFTPAILQALRYNVTRWKLPVQNFLFAHDLLNDFIAGNTFSTYYDPVSKMEIIQTGNIGSMFGMNFTTDGFREPTLRVLQDGDAFTLTSPEYLGGYTDRGPVQSTPQDTYPDGVPARGWYMFEHIGVAVANSKGVAKASRS